LERLKENNASPKLIKAIQKALKRSYERNPGSVRRIAKKLVLIKNIKELNEKLKELKKTMTPT
jgi:hypothetical protein